MKLRRSHIAFAMSTALSMFTVSNSFAAAGGPGLEEGDDWQQTLQAVLNFPPIGMTIEESLMHEEFYVPNAKSHGLITARNREIKVTLAAKHLNGNGKPDQNLRWAIVDAPLHGSLTGEAPNMVYTPNTDYTGFDKIVFKATDVDGNTGQGTIDIKVEGSYTLFESGQVRPLAINSTGDRLYALNTPDGKLEIFDVSSDTPQYIRGINVGTEPVAISLRNDNEAWVVNHISDSVSVVDLSNDWPKITRTLHVGDEPMDVVFAGRNKSKAFITTARRGQHSPSGLESMTPSVGRADVWVFNANAPENSPERIVNLYGMAPRAMATNAEGSKVYVSIYKSGNKSTLAAHNFQESGPNATQYNKIGPLDDKRGVLAPNTGVIVKHNGEDWVDMFGTTWNDSIYFDLPDYDVFELDPNNLAAGPIGRHSGVGNALFNLAVNPANGSVYVSNMDARNELIYEGRGKRSPVQTLRGRFIQNQITVIDASGKVSPRDLNTHLSDDRPEGSAEDNAKSLAMPVELVVDDSGEQVYVAAFSSSKVAVISTEQLESGDYTSDASNHITVSGGGPAGLVLDDARDRLFVLTRFNNSIAVIDTQARAEIASAPMYNPEPDFIVEGRPFLYDARFSSGRGDSSCGSCHLFGDMDGLAWELGNPDGVTLENPIPYSNRMVSNPAMRIHHPLKGPMLTQSLRGLEFQGGQHWRADKTGKTRVGGESQERAAFQEFRGAFEELLGRPTAVSEEEMETFTDFVLQLRYPPNPNRNIDDTLTAKAKIGENVYFNKKSTGFDSYDDKIQVTCNDCHEVDPSIQRFGTNTKMSFEGVESVQDMKVPHLRNVYSRIGMFGQVLRPEDNTSTGRFMGDQVTGYGLSHDGAVDTMENFLTVRVFHVDDADVAPVFEYVTQVPTGLAPMVGQQVTLTPDDQSQIPLLSTMVDEASAHLNNAKFRTAKCELTVSGMIDNKPHSSLYFPAKSGVAATLMSDTGESFSLGDLVTASKKKNNSLTFMCAPTGNGKRIALDRDEDGLLNGDDVQTRGRKATSMLPADPNAPVIRLTFNRNDQAFSREQVQREDGTFPDFTSFSGIDFFPSFFTSSVPDDAFAPETEEESHSSDPAWTFLSGLENSTEEPSFINDWTPPAITDVPSDEPSQPEVTGSKSSGGGAIGILSLGLLGALTAGRRRRNATLAQP